ncbi:MAG: hypothetical protein E7492_04130 [Ruminococcaceae bacterium]|nr:hypothetical protein [Oscillospiraceae bacterium]
MKVSTLMQIRLTPEQDRRRKLLPKDYEDIRREYATGKFTLKKLAEIYGVSSTAIKYVVDDAYAEKARTRSKEYAKRRPYNQSKRMDNYRSLRDYKFQLYEKGELVISGLTLVAA